MADVAVIGAGVAGVTAARQLVAAGHRVTVFEKSRGFGGRLATRRVPSGRVDHGAPWFTLRDARAQAEFAPLIAASTLYVWADRLTRWDGATLRTEPPTAGQERWAAVDGMAGLVGQLAAGLEVRLNQRLVTLGEGTRWTLTFEAGDVGYADAVVLTIPAPQAAELVSPLDPDLGAALRRVAFDPCLVAILELAGPSPTWRGVAAVDGPVQWIGNETSKRPCEGTILTVHASGGWSRENFASPDDDVLAALTAEASRIVGAPLVGAQQLKRWRFAKPVTLAPSRCLVAATGSPLVCAGDWSVAPRVEGAVLGGMAAADWLIETFRG